MLLILRAHVEDIPTLVPRPTRPAPLPGAAEALSVGVSFGKLLQERGWSSLPPMLIDILILFFRNFFSISFSPWLNAFPQLCLLAWLSFYLIWRFDFPAKDAMM